MTSSAFTPTFSSKAVADTLTTVSGSFTASVVSFSQPTKAPAAMVCTLVFVRSTAARFSQFRKAFCPMASRVSANSTFSTAQPENAFLPREVTPDLITTFLILEA